MVACERQLLGLVLAIIGFVGSVIICALPTWKVTIGFDDTRVYFNIVEGLWKKCGFAANPVITSCMDYEHIHKELRDARALIIIAIIIELLGILLGAAGRRFIIFVRDERQRSKMALTAGIAFLIAGLLVVIPVSWTTDTFTSNFLPTYSPNDASNRMLVKTNWGASLYIGWFTAVLLFLGGGLVCSSFFSRDETD
ncbi:claudin-9-like [Pelmatolapia mariae]|uniref:claudin-9-like n=1 Tax=Pelmatolapia mariae TaxID=158779 RepID=UPI002FE5EF7B